MAPTTPATQTTSSTASSSTTTAYSDTPPPGNPYRWYIPVPFRPERRPWSPNCGSRAGVERRRRL
ncbi:hypothetical protein GBAR_LOCUS9472 [Geodia barretti]|uniref:Uncharacterized protein n=1 Tax=Geodia barretti TaxID=519541 RepID=A0AA35RRH8_GEOBA|nr:hypothetical protein GBAR_LOCUS9472 [Geodia barretti]